MDSDFMVSLWACVEVNKNHKNLGDSFCISRIEINYKIP